MGLMLGTGLALAGCEEPTPRIYQHYRFTVCVKTPEGDVTASHVVEAETGWSEGAFASMQSPGIGYMGDALYVDLGRRGLLFFLIGDPVTGPNSWRPSAVLASPAYDLQIPEKSDKHTENSLRRAKLVELSKDHTARSVPTDRLPFAVRFRDINDPKSVEKVDPTDLAASFGKGVALKWASVAFTDDAVTRGIEKLFPWWKQHQYGGYDNMPPSTIPERAPLAALVGNSFFSVPG
jgi:hypothetical protein